MRNIATHQNNITGWLTEMSKLPALAPLNLSWNDGMESSDGKNSKVWLIVIFVCYISLFYCATLEVTQSNDAK